MLSSDVFISDILISPKLTSIFELTCFKHDMNSSALDTISLERNNLSISPLFLLKSIITVFPPQDESKINTSLPVPPYR